MPRRTHSQKTIAATLLLLMLTNVFAPTVSYALTAGPTAPEATSFEPVDTTDLVNLNTGSFTYNLPLLEVPGPEGGYPLSLSYHAGIQPDLDASWVGLGWTLNPGAINRNVNGTPDDWNGVEGSVRDFWSGGEQWKGTVGVSLGYSVASVRAGLTFGNDTYRGFGVGGYIGAGVSLNDMVGIGATVGVSPWGDPYGSLGLSIGGGLGNSGLTGSIGVGISTNFQSMEAGINGGVGWSAQNGNANTNNSLSKNTGGSILGASIGTNNGKPSFDIGGVSPSITGNNAGKISTSSSGLTLDIPVWYGVNVTLGYEKQRYWSDERQTFKSFGSYIQYVSNDYNTRMATVYDTYELLEGDSKNIVEYPDPAFQQGGGFSEYDQYLVLGQGLSGNIRPYAFQQKIYRQSKTNTNNHDEDGGITKWTFLTYTGDNTPQTAAPVFRFVNDFSNRYDQNYTQSAAAGSYNEQDLYGTNGTQYAVASFDNAPRYGNNDGNFGFGGGNKLAGSKSVKVGISILPSRVDTPATRPLLRARPDAITGFEITNASGVTYHYGLPAYANEEELYQAIKTDKSNSFNRLKRPKAYAYTWYLTAITGPDFVDRNNNHIADEGDWGYYVNFEYGLWNENFMWRNPAEGFRLDDDPSFFGASMGQKEVYYLNAIKTRTHTALFEKEERLDGKGARRGIEAKDAAGKAYLYENETFNATSQPVMRLNKIYLLKNSDVPANLYSKSGSGKLQSNVSYNGRTVPDPDGFTPSLSELNIEGSSFIYESRKENVLDKEDLTDIRSAMETKAVRVIDFSYDYSLCRGASNSFYASAPGAKYGKLTLTAVKFRGKSGADLLPATKFDYNLSDNDIKRSTYSYSINPTPSSASYKTTFSGEAYFEVGDLIETDEANPRFLGVITQKNGSTYTLMNNPNTNLIIEKIRTTKNPYYDKDLVDVWQMYKSNARRDLVSKNANRYRRTDEISAKSADVWSLRSIRGPYGEKIAIEYESNTYDNVLLNDSYPFVLSQLEALERQNEYIKKAKVYVPYEDLGYNSINDLVDVNGVGRIVMLLDFGNNNGDHQYVPIYSEFTVTAINGDNSFEASFNNQVTGDVSFVRNKKSLFGKILRGLLSGGVSIIQEFTTNGYSYKGCKTGNISFFKKSRPYEYGGGSRVKKVSVIANGTVNSTLYDYANMANGLSSGVTTFTPTTLPVYDEALASNTSYSQALKDYRTLLCSGIDELYSYAREIPSPAVFYEYVSVSNRVQNAGAASREKEGKTTYQFEVPNTHIIRKENTYTKDWGVPPNSNYVLPVVERNVTVKNFTASIGNLKRMITYDNNGKKLTETINNYLHDGLVNESDSMFFVKYKQRLEEQFGGQGYLHERNLLAKSIVDGNPGGTNIKQRFVTYSSRETYPSIPLGTTIINYVNGSRTTTENLAFDFYSGAVTKTLNVDANGNRFVDSLVPAYRKYPEMGLKSIDANSKNMLTQTAANYSYRANNSNEPIGLISAAINTWSKNVGALTPAYSTVVQNTAATGNVWRPKMTYNWAPAGSTSNGMTPLTGIGLFVDFDWLNQDNPAAQNTGWVKTSEMTLYDIFSHVLEASDINNLYAATKMGYNHSKVMMSGGPSRYTEIAYSGAEDEPVSSVFNGDIKLGVASVQSAPAYVHTGVRSVQLNSGKGFLYEVPVNKLDNTHGYFASVWVKSESGIVSNAGIFYDNGSGQVNGTLSAANPQGWQLATIQIPASAITGTTLTVGCYNNGGSAAYFDDIRFHPINAGINTYVYDNLSGELTYILDNNNFFTKFEYDSAGRLVKTYRETTPYGIRPVSEFIYHYGQTAYKNDALISYTFTKNNCPPNITSEPSSVTLTIPEGQFISLVSKADANRMALDYGQQKINQEGDCGYLFFRVEYDNQYNTYEYSSYVEYADVYIRAYTDPECTIPYPYPADVNYRHIINEQAYSPSSPCTTGVSQYDFLVNVDGAYCIGTGIPVYRIWYNSNDYSEITCIKSFYYSVFK